MTINFEMADNFVADKELSQKAIGQMAFEVFKNSNDPNSDCTKMIANIISNLEIALQQKNTKFSTALNANILIEKKSVQPVVRSLKTAIPDVKASLRASVVTAKDTELVSVPFVTYDKWKVPYYSNINILVDSDVAHKLKQRGLRFERVELAHSTPSNPKYGVTINTLNGDFAVNTSECRSVSQLLYGEAFYNKKRIDISLHPTLGFNFTRANFRMGKKK